MKLLNNPWLRAVAFTLLLQVLLISAIADDAISDLFFVCAAVVTVATGFFYFFFPGSRFFVIILANTLALYTCLFVVFVSANFEAISSQAALIAYPLPVLGFIAGAWLRRGEIRRMVADGATPGEWERRHRNRWLLPVLVVAALTFVDTRGVSGERLYLEDVFFLIEIGIITAIVGLLSRDVCAFLVYTGTVFSEFFTRITKLAVPAFAFLSMYSLLVIVFACLYRILDQWTEESLFLVGGEARDILFPEALYFSIVTLSTVGYGDISPLRDAARIMVSMQIVMGVLLMLFGFAQIMRYAED